MDRPFVAAAHLASAHPVSAPCAPAAALLRHEHTLACPLPPSTSAFSPPSVARGVARRTLSYRSRRTATVTATAGYAAASSSDESESGGSSGRRAAIDVEGLSLSLGRAQVLRECSLRVPEGQLWMLLGPNGCGKSTLLKVLAGLLQPNSGRLRVDAPRSFVFQNPDHQVIMPTVNADVAFGLGRLNPPLPEEEVQRRVAEALEAVGMAEYGQRLVSTLSGGQKQRVAIAGALAEDSHTLLLDELTTFLDSQDQFAVIKAVRNVVSGSSPGTSSNTAHSGTESSSTDRSAVSSSGSSSRGRGGRRVTALWVTHRLEELQFADGAAYMDGGRVVVMGSVPHVVDYITRQQQQQQAASAGSFWSAFGPT